MISYKYQEEPTTIDSIVNVSLIESKSQRLLKYLQDNVVYRNVDAVVEYEHLCDVYLDNVSGVSSSSASDLELILKYLEVNQKCIINQTEVENKTLVKFTLNTNSSVAPLTQVESSYQSLKYAEKKLDEEIAKLTSQIEQTNVDIKAQLRQSNKSAALKLLKKRKHMEKSLQGKEETQANIQAMMMSIQQADTNQLTFDVYSKSAEALKEANKLIKIDKVDDTMADIQDALSANAEIEEALAKSPVGFKYAALDEKELNDELNNILAEHESANSLAETTFDAADARLAQKLKFPAAKTVANGGEEDSFNMDDILESLNSIKVPTDTPKKLPSSASKLSAGSDF